VLSSAHCPGIRSEKCFQCQRIPSRNCTDVIGSLEAFFTFAEVLPKMRKMIERVRIDPLFHRIGSLLVRNGHVSNWPSDCSPQSFGHLSHS